MKSGVVYSSVVHVTSLLALACYFRYFQGINGSGIAPVSRLETWRQKVRGNAGSSPILQSASLSFSEILWDQRSEAIGILNEVADDAHLIQSCGDEGAECDERFVMETVDDAIAKVEGQAKVFEELGLFKDELQIALANKADNELEIYRNTRDGCGMFGGIMGGYGGLVGGLAFGASAVMPPAFPLVMFAAITIGPGLGASIGNRANTLLCDTYLESGREREFTSAIYTIRNQLDSFKGLKDKIQHFKAKANTFKKSLKMRSDKGKYKVVADTVMKPMLGMLKVMKLEAPYAQHGHSASEEL